MAKQYANGEPAVRLTSREEEEANAQALAERLGLPYVNVLAFRVDPDLFRSMPVGSTATAARPLNWAVEAEPPSPE